jgi:hypothetical protein
MSDIFGVIWIAQKGMSVGTGAKKLKRGRRIWIPILIANFGS